MNTPTTKCGHDPLSHYLPCSKCAEEEISSLHSHLEEARTEIKRAHGEIEALRENCRIHSGRAHMDALDAKLTIEILTRERDEARAGKFETACLRTGHVATNAAKRIAELESMLGRANRYIDTERIKAEIRALLGEEP